MTLFTALEDPSEPSTWQFGDFRPLLTSHCSLGSFEAVIDGHSQRPYLHINQPPHLKLQGACRISVSGGISGDEDLKGTQGARSGEGGE